MFIYWLLAGFLCFCAGDLWVLSAGGSFIPQIPEILSCIAIVMLLFGSGLMRERGVTVALPCCLLLLFLSGVGGWLLGSSMLQKAKCWEPLWDRTVTLYGEAEPETIKEKPGGVTFLFQAEKPVPGRVRVFVKTGDKNPELTLQRLTQHKLRITGIAREMVFLRNPGTYNGELAARIKNITGAMSIEAGQLHVTDEGLSAAGRLRGWNRQLRLRAQSLCRTEGGPLLISMILGGYQGVDEETADVFRDNGLAHLLAVSGTHVALAATLLSLLLRGLPEGLRFYSTLFFLWFYAVLCGLQPAIARATVMATVWLWGRRYGETADSLRLLLLTAWGMLCLNPLWLADISFQLSFATTAGLLLAGERVTARLPASWPELLRQTAGISLTAQLAVLPFCVFYFHRISLIAVVSNLLLLPAFSLAAACFVPGLLCAWGWLAVSRCFFAPAEWLLTGGLALGRLLQKLPWAVADVADWGFLRSASYLAFLAGWLDLPVFAGFSRKQRQLWLGAAGGLFFLVWGIQAFWPHPLTVYFIDVGQGDAALVQTPAGKNLLIDTGGLQGEQDIGRSVIVPFLRYLGVRQIDALCLSHGDHDHAGGAAFTARSFPVKRLFLGANTEGSEDVRRLLHTLTQDTAVCYMKTGETWQIEDCRIVAASASGGCDMNSSSLVLQLFCGKHSLVFPGDADQDTELSAIPLLQEADVLKVGHHGSRTSSAPAFLRKLHPRLAVISAGRNNRYGHPHTEVLEELAGAGCTVLRTDRLGAVKVVLEGSDLHWYSYAFQKHSF